MELIKIKGGDNMDYGIITGNYFSGNPIEFEWGITPWSQVELNQNIYMLVSIAAEDSPLSNTWTIVKTEKLFPSISGVMKLDVAPVVDTYLKYFIPPVNLDQTIAAKGQYRRFRISVVVYIGAFPIISIGEVPPQFITVIKAGNAYEYPVKPGYYGPAVLRKPLIFVDEAIRIFKEDVFFLYYLVFFLEDFTYARVQLKYLLNDVEETVDDNIPGIVTTPIDPTTVSVNLIPAGYNQLGLDSLLPDGAIPISYTISIFRGFYDSTEPIELIEPVTFELDQRKFYNTTQLLYRNSLGSLHPLRLIGQVDFEADYKGDKGERIPPPSYLQDGNIVAQQSIPWSEEQPKFSGNTGFQSKFDSDRMRDLFLAKEVFEVKDGRLLPVVIDKKNVKFFANNDNLINILISWQHAFVNNFYSSKIIPDTACPDVMKLDWRQTGTNQITAYLLLPFGYDYAQLKIHFVDDSSEQLFFVDGNSGPQKINFVRPGWATGDTDIIVSARVVCNRYNQVPSYGSWLTLDAKTIKPEGAVVALDDFVNLPKGSIIAFPIRSPLLNDYDPEGGAIEAIPDAGGTHDGGAFTIDAAGVTTYTPPSSVYIGLDYFDYRVKKTGGTIITTATYRVNVF